MMPKSSEQEHSLRLMGEYVSSLRFWTWHNVAIAHWYGKPTGPAARTLWQLTDQRLLELGAATKISFVHLVANEIAMPDAETRSVIVESSKIHESRLALAALVVNGTGFWASAIRGFATSVSLLVPKTVHIRICGSPEELIPWFPTEHARKTGVSFEPQAFVDVLTKALVAS